MDVKNIGKALGVLAVTAVTAWAGYLWAGARRSEEVQADVRVLRVELQGEMALMRAEQARMRDDLQRLTRAVEEQLARRQR